ncbi:hypothetical protein KCP78_05880 [Salmonella enterica subsp. enterica]|nr:hypothetical protein KCP78_05880 [Salmonella enterica subsp. enterica]
MLPGEHMVFTFMPTAAASPRLATAKRCRIAAGGHSGTHKIPASMKGRKVRHLGDLPGVSQVALIMMVMPPNWLLLRRV